ncbi:SH3 domain-containing protein [Stappia sp. GBMRC 2046]|uniref:SH3 domain-containing protein n=1 Tax=Stappia sediminis TaxID=2692190 RepID=A0A7X3S9P5_9HYPH|nr:SH3 domain-containing protein [Stappia sediminis]MXN67064.1 SH3 domain-containing protein [Stappia sediminis]
MLRLYLKILIAAILLQIPVSSEVRANLRYKFVEFDGFRIALVTGAFEPSDRLETFARFIEARGVRVILFDSGGGNPYKAMEFGRYIRSTGLATTQVKEGECASACALAFMGGVIRLAEPGSIGVHKSSFSGEFGINAHAAVSAIQELTAETISYMIEMGVDPALLQLALKYESNDIRYLSGSEMKRFRLITEGVDAPPRDVTVSPRAANLPPLGGEQSTAVFLSPEAARSGAVRHPAGQAPLKQAARGKSADLAVLSNGERLTILGNHDRWYRVRAGTLTGYMHHTWVYVDQFALAPFDQRHVQVRSFRSIEEVNRYVRSSRLPLSAYRASNGWYAVTLRNTYDKQHAINLARKLKNQGAIPSDSFITYGNTYLEKVCCE